MPTFSKASEDRLATCDERLQRLFRAVIADHDCVICVGHRNEADQDAACKAGRSREKWPHSKHNSVPSLAVDVAPEVDGKIPWNDILSFRKFAIVVKAKADELGIDVEWGGDWVSWKDWDHWQVKPEESQHASVG